MQRELSTNALTRRQLLKLLAVAAGGSLLAACAPAAAPSPTAAPKATDAPKPATTAPAPAATAAAPAQAPATAAPAAAKEPSGKLTVACAMDANNLDPIKITVVEPEQSALQQVFSALVVRADDMSIKPALAESWKQLDATTWQFNLRKGVKFHNGEPFNAAAAKFSYDRALDPKNQSMDFFTKAVGLTRCEIVDDYTIKLSTKAPAAGFIVRLWTFNMVPPKYYTDNPPEVLSTKPVGAGPYRFVEWKKNDHLTIEANPDYWGPKPAIKTQIWRIVPEAGTRLSMLKAGDIDLAGFISPDHAKSLQGATDLRVEVCAGGTRVGVGFTFGKGFPTEDKRVRQALNYAIDYDTILKSLFQPHPPVHRFNAVMPEDVDPSIKPYSYDVAKAKQLLADAGHPNGFQADMAYISSVRSDVVQAVCDYWAKVGVQVKLAPMDNATFQPLWTGKKFTTTMFWYQNASLLEGTTDLLRYSNTDAFQGTNWQNAEYESTLQAAIAEVDPAKQRQLRYRAQQILNEEAPLVFLWNNNDLHGVSNKIDWKPRPDQRTWAWSAKPK